MAAYKKIGVRCEGATCPNVAELEIEAYPSDKEFQHWLATVGFIPMKFEIKGKSESRILCAKCAEKLSGVFK